MGRGVGGWGGVERGRGGEGEVWGETGVGRGKGGRVWEGEGKEEEEVW